MFKAMLAFLLFVVFVATVQGADQCCTGMQSSLADMKSHVQAMHDQLADLPRKLEHHFNRHHYQNDSCPTGFVYLPLARSCYRVVYESHTWASADTRCRQLHRDAHLAAITSPDESIALKSYLRLQFVTNPASTVCQKPNTTLSHLGKMLWISGQRLDKNSCIDPFVWKLSADEQLPFTFTDWGGREPTCSGNREQCVHLASSWNYRWNDQSCYTDLCSLCEYKPA